MKDAVQVIIPIIEDSIDESFDRILEKKRSISEEYLGERGVMEEVVDDLRRSRIGVGTETKKVIA